MQTVGSEATLRWGTRQEATATPEMGDKGRRWHIGLQEQLPALQRLEPPRVRWWELESRDGMAAEGLTPSPLLLGSPLCRDQPLYHLEASRRGPGTEDRLTQDQSRGYVKFQNISPVQTTAVLMGKERKSLKAVRLKFECADTFPGDLVKNAHSGWVGLGWVGPEILHCWSAVKMLLLVVHGPDFAKRDYEIRVREALPNSKF